MQAWLIVGVILILGSGERWAIPLVASVVFTGIVILVPAAYEYLLSDAQKAAVDRQLSAVGQKLRIKRRGSSTSGAAAVVTSPYNKDTSAGI